MKYLKDEGLAEDTIVVYTSDHGDMMGSLGKMSKRVWYEESIGVPFMIRWPGRIKAGRDDILFGNEHIMPTLLGLMSLPIPSKVEGEDFSALLRGGKVKKPRSALIEYICTLRRKTPESTDYYYYPAKSYVLSHGEWRGIRTQRHTYVVQITKGKIVRYLYDLVNDPYQMKPLKTEQHRKVSSLGVLTDCGKPDKQMESFERELKMWLKKTSDPFLKWLDDEEKIPKCLL